jgi:nitrogen regulatory protein PII
MTEAGKLDLITLIVERGEADKTVKAALESGAHGATIFFARGTGVRERLGRLGFLIQPEKEVILIVTPREITQQVFEAAIKVARLEEPGRGFAYIQEVSHAVGFVEQLKKP